MSRLRVRPQVASVLLLSVALMGCSGGVTTTGSDDGPGSGGTTSSGPVSAPTSAMTTAPPPPPPETGECRQLTTADISRYSNAVTTTRCGGQHTSYTFDVQELPPNVAFEGVDLANDAVQSAAAEACTASFVDFIGGGTETRALSRLTVTYFLPQQQAFDRGAHWVRCDVVALQSAGFLAPLPEDLKGFLSSQDALDEFGLCSRGDPGVSGSLLVMCSQPHTYRAVAALRLGTSTASYPGEDEALADGRQRCEDLIADLLGVSGGFTYGWTYPSSTDWVEGQRFGYCWNESDG